MRLTREETDMIEGKHGYPAQKAMEVLVGLGECYDAARMVAVSSVHVVGSTAMGKAGASFIQELAARGGKAAVLAHVNPMSIEPYVSQELGLSQEAVQEQMAINAAYREMGFLMANTCTPYTIGHCPGFGEHLAWSESSAVVFANSVLGARTNAEGGPSSLAAALAGRTPECGLHLDSNRRGGLQVAVTTQLDDLTDYGALGFFVGKTAGNRVPVLTGIAPPVSRDALKQLGAAAAASGNVALYHIVGVTPEAPTIETAFGTTTFKRDKTEFGSEELASVKDSLSKAGPRDADLVVFGCPHASITEIAGIARHLAGRKLAPGVELWVITSRMVKSYAAKMGYAEAIEGAGGRILCEMCPAVAPRDFLRKRGNRVVATNSAKLTYYLESLQGMLCCFGSTRACVEAATASVRR